jgi:hypothetical protein
MQAPRAGTPGYRSPEVLLKYPLQTTGILLENFPRLENERDDSVRLWFVLAVDVWSL